MSLHLKQVRADNADEDKGLDPRGWIADYVVKFRAKPDCPINSGKVFWFDAQIERTPYVDDATRYLLKCALEIQQPTFHAALAKLAEWARALAGGITECGALPEDGFPLEMPRVTDAYEPALFWLVWDRSAEDEDGERFKKDERLIFPSVDLAHSHAITLGWPAERIPASVPGQEGRTAGAVDLQIWCIEGRKKVGGVP